ncbi:Ger(x)C family spore germination protein [Brevibacillus fluminis]|uniref:Ger(X)C family spore germination protein n=1 Tax=Brevibacillus fluminis TaxID=511487 RepID=A0A3M8DXR8_9BACL|nr:Ger(x)C family spore germination protein [Brevibacillus fluminis]RNB92319.1 Ger(x)C family spore germination protein [Brevibacillus fluminis]
MNLGRRFAGWAMLLILVFPLAGCWDTKDINKRYLPIVMAVNKLDDGQYHIILHYPLPNGKGLDSFEEKAPTISKAVDLIRTNAEKDISLIHVKLLLLHESFAKKGIGELLNFSIRSNDISAKAFIAVMRGNFEQLNKAIDTRKRPETAPFDTFSKQAGWTPNISSATLWQTYRAWHKHTEDIAIPLLTMGKKGGFFTMEGSAVMKGDRMVSHINKDETMMYNLFQGTFTGGTIEVMGHAAVQVVKSSITNHAQWQQQVPVLTSKINIVILGLEEKGPPLSNKELKTELEKIIYRRIAELSTKLIACRSDLLGAGNSFRGMMSESVQKQWKTNWFPKLRHEIDLNVTIGNAGYLKNGR